MKILNPLRSILTFGNLFLLFRNVSFSGRKYQIIMYGAASIEIISTIINGFSIAYYNLLHHPTDVIYVYSVFANSLLFAVLSLYHSKRFYQLLSILDVNSGYLSKDDIYFKDIKRKTGIFKVWLIIYLGLKVVTIVLSSRYRILREHKIPIIFITGLEINAILVDIRFLYEYCLLYTMLYLISEQLESIIRFILKKKTFLASIYECTEINDVSDAVTKKHTNDIARWSLAYSNIVEATSLFNKVFAVQISIMIVSTMLYISIYLYSISYLSIYGYFDIQTLVKYGIKTVVLLIHIFVLSMAAQKIQCNVDNLKRHLAKLLLQSITNYKCYRAVKDLLRLVSSLQMRITAFGSITVDMTLPPTCILLFTSYTVIALQLNNVI